MSSQNFDDLIYCAFFFIDIVGLSNPLLSTETQRTKITILNETIYSCKTFLESSKEKIMILPTGDGMLIGFKNGLEEPINLAIEFHKKISDYNNTATEVEKIETRIGCNIGHVFVVKDIFENINLWGPGAIIARRIMDMGENNHILLSSDLANDLIEVSDNYKKILHPLQNFGIKHGENLLVYSAYGKGFGNSSIPEEKIKTQISHTAGTTNSILEKVIFNIITKEPDEPTKFECFYFFSNNSNNPIYELTLSLVTNSKEEFKTIDLKALDEKNTELDIAKILSPTHFSKNIVLKLNNPIFTKESGRLIKLVYESKLSKNTFENIFLNDAKNFELNFNHFANLDLNPKLFYFDNDNGNKNLLDRSFKSTKGMFTIHQWKNQKINAKDLIHLEW